MRSILTFLFLCLVVSEGTVSAHPREGEDYLIAAINSGHSNSAAENDGPEEAEAVWTCPTGWVNYTGGDTIMCIYLSDRPAMYTSQAAMCYRQNEAATPVKFVTSDKKAFLQDLVTDRYDEFQLFLDKSYGYDTPFIWRVDGTPSLELKSDTMDHDGRLYASISPAGLESRPYPDSLKYICERPPVCKPGWFGKTCDNRCHCAEEPCQADARSCKSGCQAGWAGPLCSFVKEEPEVHYFCINSTEEHGDSYVDIHIHTKGVNYRDIHALKANSSEAAPWCSGTSLAPASSDYQQVGIILPLNATGLEEIQHGDCAGEEISPNVFQWTLTIQEYEGIILDTDTQVVITCDLADMDTLQRSAQFSLDRPEITPPRTKLSPDVADVRLDVVDPFTKQPLTEVPVGSPAMLQVSFGYEDDSLINSVSPYDCIATTPEGAEVKSLLDHFGCPDASSPLSAFSYPRDNSSNTIRTKGFPIFAFQGSDTVEFRCSFDLCFDTDGRCPEGCRPTHYHRRRRNAAETLADTSDNERRRVSSSSGVVHILADVPNQGLGNMNTPSLEDNNHLNTLDTTGKAKHHQDAHRTEYDAQNAPQTRSAWRWFDAVTLGLFALFLLLLFVMALVFYLALGRSHEPLRWGMSAQRKGEDREGLRHHHSREKLLGGEDVFNA